MKLIGLIRAVWESLDSTDRARVVFGWVGVVAWVILELAEGDVDLVRLAIVAALGAVLAPIVIVSTFRFRDWFWRGWK